jgi:hypothetical protein
MCVMKHSRGSGTDDVPIMGLSVPCTLTHSMKYRWNMAKMVTIRDTAANMVYRLFSAIVFYTASENIGAASSCVEHFAMA